LCLYLASLGASISLFETVVANWREVRRVPRQRSAFTIAALCFVLAVGPALSSNVLSGVRFGGRSLLEFFDAALINWCLPITALLISQVVCWRLKQEMIAAEFVANDQPDGAKIYGHWIFVLRYLVTPIVVVALGLQVVSLF
jgi:SNF family Na+-dependent transporter